MSSTPDIPTPTINEENERRRDLRVPLRVLRVESEHNGEVFFGYAVNISNTGLCIQTSNPKVTGTKIHISFTLPSQKEKIDCNAEVIWHRNFTGPKAPPPGMGLRFIELPTATLEMIQRFIDQE